AKSNANAAISCWSNFLDLPGLDAGEAMLAHTLAMAEPGKNNRNAAANRMILIKAAALAQEKERLLIFLFEVRDMRAMKVNPGGAPFGDDFEHGQLAAAIHEGDASKAFSWLPLEFRFRHNSPRCSEPTIRTYHFARRAKLKLWRVTKIRSPL